MASKENFELEYLEKYHGDCEQVTKTIEDCPQCGKKLIITHWADTSTLVMEENSRCIECDFGHRKVLHSLN
jgi:ssDNA-binding Zn-finger/Zn-ribbon topoisomerase 1